MYYYILQHFTYNTIRVLKKKKTENKRTKYALINENCKICKINLRYFQYRHRMTTYLYYIRIEATGQYK